jgi:hypothetical protein
MGPAKCGMGKGWLLCGHGGFAAMAASLSQGLLSMELGVLLR